jgi:hypothetical protein
MHPHPLTLFFSLLSHFVLDFFVPHWNPHLYTEFHKKGGISNGSVKIALIDGVVGVGLTLYFFFSNLTNLNLAFLFAFSSLFAVLPDLIEVPYYFFGCKAKWLKDYVHFEHLHQARANVFWGSVTQVLTSLAALKILFF